MQQPFMKLLNLHSFYVGLATLLAFGPIHRMPSIPPRPTAVAAVIATPVDIGNVDGPFRVAGAWNLESRDIRLRGISGLTASGDALQAITDLGVAIRLPISKARAWSATFIDLRDGPGTFGYKVSRDAEAVTGDGKGGWLVAFEQRHSIWRYDRDFSHGEQVAAIDRGWAHNSGAEAILLSGDRPTIVAQNGDEVLTLVAGRWRGAPLDSGGWEVSDAASAPDGATWLLLRRFGIRGFENALAPMVRRTGGYALGPVTTIPKGWSDNMEGLAITPLQDGLRFWLISDDGHRLFARTLLIAIDLPRTQENARR